jgi:hypothetical protein
MKLISGGGEQLLVLHFFDELLYSVGIKKKKTAKFPKLSTQHNKEHQRAHPGYSGRREQRVLKQ